MRIRNNIGALNAHRQLGINNKRSANAKEKLSSGLRINRAGDDAAGLSISEKMRGQIRGLNQASRNAQDGISLIQTAEGALGEVHSILQRVRELANQAATDTNTLADRKEIQKEINQLLDEIDRIADNTEFNTKKILDGTMSAAGIDADVLAALEGRAAIGSIVVGRSAASSGTIQGTIGGNDNVDFTISGGEDEAYNGIQIQFVTTESDGTAKYSDGLITVALKGNKVYKAKEINDLIAGIKESPPSGVEFSQIRVDFGGAGKGSEIASLTMYSGGTPGYFDLVGGSNGVKLAISAGKENGARGNLEIAFVAGKEGGGDEGTAWDISGKNKKLTVTLDRTKSYNSEDIEKLIRGATAPADLDLDMDVFRVKGKGTIEAYKLDNGVSVTLGGGIDAAKGSEDSATGDDAAVKGGGGLSAAAGGTVIHIGANQGQNLTVHINSMKTSALGRGAVTTEPAGPAVAAGASTQPADLIEAVAATGTETIGGVEFTISAGRDNGALANDVEIVIVKVPEGSLGSTWADNILTITLLETDHTPFSAENIEGLIQGVTTDAPSGLDMSLFRMTGEGTFAASVIPSTGVTFTLKGGVTGNDERDDFGDYADSDAGAAGSIASLKVSAAAIAAVNTDKEAAALTNSGVLTQAGADSAITGVNDAIEQVSAERSKLGAYQNRLEHTIGNLGTSAENLRASESRIRDLDMAEEVMEFTKSNILSQAATTMLAQANMAPQTILQLLG